MYSTNGLHYSTNLTLFWTKLELLKKVDFINCMEFINLKQVILNSHLEEYTIKSSKNVNNHPVELIVKYM